MMFLMAVASLPLLTLASQIPIFSGVPPHESSNPEVNDLRDRVHSALPQVEALRDIGGTAGISIGVMSHGHIVLDHNLGFADVERRLVANSSTRYPIASITKAFVASTIAQLVHDGVLDWKEPIIKYIPELAFEHSQTLAHELSLIDMLSHRTGLARLDALWLGADSQTFIPKSFTVAICKHLPPVFPLRTKWLYNNWMYALAGEIIERVTDTTWGHVLAESILKPLSLSNTTVIASEVPEGSLALPYMILDDLTSVPIGRMGLTDGNIMTSAGGIRSTVGDLMTWGKALLSIYQDGNIPLAPLDIVLSSHSIINSSIASDELYALGFAKVVTPAQFGKIGFNPGLVDTMPLIGSSSRPEQVFYHSGAGAGYNHCFMLIPGSQTVIVVLTNSVSQGDTADWIAQALLQAVLGEKQPVNLESYAKEAAAKFKTIHKAISDTLDRGRKPDTKEPSHDALVGRYWHSTRAFYIDVFQDGSKLQFNLNGQSSQEHTLSHYNDDTFIFLPSSEQRLRSGLFHYMAPAWLLHFHRNVDGSFERITWNIDQQSPEPETFLRDVI